MVSETSRVKRRECAVVDTKYSGDKENGYSSGKGPLLDICWIKRDYTVSSRSSPSATTG